MLARRWPAPLFIFDTSYDPGPLSQGLSEARLAILVRLRRDRCFKADSTSQPPIGRPRRHVTKLVCVDPTPWPTPSDEFAVEVGRYGAVRARAGLAPKQQDRAARGSRKTRPVMRGTLISRWRQSTASTQTGLTDRFGRWSSLQ